MSLRWMNVTVLACCAACSGEKGPPPQRPVPVAAAKVTTKEIDDFADYLGGVRSPRSVDVHALVEGRVAKILAPSGAHVGEGALLVQIDPARQETAVSSAVAATGLARAEVERAHATLSQYEAMLSGKRAALSLAQSDARRTDSLVQANAITRADAERGQTGLATAEAEVAALERQVAAQQAAVGSYEKSLDESRASAQRQGIELQYYRVAAPFAGTVGDVPVKVGDRVTPTTVLTTLDDEEAFDEICVSVPAENGPRLAGPLVVRLLDEDLKPTAEGRVTFVSPRVDPATQSILVKALVPPNAAVRAQQAVRTRVVFGTRPGVSVPLASIARINGQSFVFVIRDDAAPTVTQTPVKLGAVLGDEVVVLAGLAPGDRYARTGLQKLRDGSRVAITETSSD